MGAALFVVGAVLGLVVLLLAVPIDVVFRFEGIEPFRGRISLRWLFGLARFRIDLPAVTRSELAQVKPEPRVREEDEKPEIRGRHGNVLAALRQPGFRRRVLRFVQDFFRAAHARQLYLRVRLGLGDPADTGRLWALVGPLDALARKLPNIEIRAEPEFVDPVFQFEGRGRLKLVPFQFVFLAIAFAFSPSSLRAWRALMGNHA